MIPEIFAAVAALGLLCAIVANTRPLVIIGLPSTIAGFVTAEMARPLILVQVAATALWIAVGALDETIGVVGAVVGGFIAGLIGIGAYGIIGQIIVATLGAILCLWIWQRVR